MPIPSHTRIDKAEKTVFLLPRYQATPQELHIYGTCGGASAGCGYCASIEGWKIVDLREKVCKGCTFHTPQECPVALKGMDNSENEWNGQCAYLPESPNLLFKEIIDACEGLRVLEVPYDVWREDGRVTGNWVLTKLAMERHLGRELTTVETACLSITRYYWGPEMKKYKELSEILWPEGNPIGLYLSWTELADKLSKL